MVGDYMRPARVRRRLMLIPPRARHALQESRSMPTRSLFLHEVVDVVGQGQYDYLEPRTGPA